MSPKNHSEQENLERASSACCHAGGMEVTARTLPAKPCVAGNDETWSTLVAKFPSVDHTAALSNATEVEDGSAPPRRPGDEYASQVPVEVSNSRSALSGPGNDGNRFAHF